MRLSAWRIVAPGLLAALVLAAPVGATGSKSTSTLDDSIVARINVVRHAHGLPLLRLSAQLHRAADGHSRSMGTFGFFAHESRDGTAFWKRIKHDYPKGSYRVWSVGETLVFTSDEIDAADVVSMWMDSPPHRKILLDRTFRDIGVSALRVTGAPGDFEGDDVTLVTADFGIRR
jgi:uncharacterized protein YkwD